MPDVNVLNVEPARTMIRKVFIERIIAAKGLKRAEEFVEGILMPTPTAVLKAARLLAPGTPREKGLGDLVVVDIGGATTDVHSVGLGSPGQAGVVRKGLPEPYAKRTVEGDLGIRYNAESILLCGDRSDPENASLRSRPWPTKWNAFPGMWDFFPRRRRTWISISPWPPAPPRPPWKGMPGRSRPCGAPRANISSSTARI